jgi:hypothetical protein
MAGPFTFFLKLFCVLPSFLLFSNLQGMILQEAEQAGFTSEDIQVAVNHCGDTNPVEWLRQGQSHQMINLFTSSTFVSVLPYVCKLILLNHWIGTIRVSEP